MIPLSNISQRKKCICMLVHCESYCMFYVSVWEIMHSLLKTRELFSLKDAQTIQVFNTWHITMWPTSHCRNGCILLIHVKMPIIGQPAKRHINGRSLNGGLSSFVIFQGTQTSIVKKPYIFVIFQGGFMAPCPPPPPSGSAHAFNTFQVVLYYISVELLMKTWREKVLFALVVWLLQAPFPEDSFTRGNL